MEPSSRERTWWSQHGKTLITVTLLVLLAGTLRVGFNYEYAVNEGNYRYAGNDDYYHYAVVRHVQVTGSHIVEDPLLNYPLPARNPRPPLYDWHVAILGQGFGYVSGEATPGEAAIEGGQYALEWGSALWGALTVIPIWLIGRATFGNRAGLWAGFLLAASPAHIQRSGFGLGDHDAFIVFFLCLGAYFLVRALQLTRDDTKVSTWTKPAAVARGFGEYMFAHAPGLAYAFLAGVAWAAIALSWEGYPYVLAIYSVYYVFQLLSNQMRGRDSTGDVLVFSTIIALNFLLTIPYYWITGNVGTTLNSTIYVVLILAVLTAALVPTRDVPAILVLPSLALIGILGLGLLFLVAPDIGNQLISANGYFNQSKLYSTIAEAQRTELGVFVFSIGFMTFFFALIGFVLATMRYLRTKERAMLFLVGWGLLSIYMGFAATRFVFNAAPIFAVLAGWVVVRILDWMNLKERLKSFQSLRQDSIMKASRSVLGPRVVLVSVFLLLTLIVPNLWFSVDAGIPSEARANYRQNHPGARDFIDNQTGAFGQGFLSEDWITVYGWLATQNTHLDPKDRPGHMAWWDYGFWEVAIAQHPTVADNFQNGYQISGRFIAAQSEQEGLDWLSVRLLEGDWAHHTRAFSPEVQAFLATENSTWPARMEAAFDDMGDPRRYENVYAVFQTSLPTLEDSADFYEKVKAATGYHIGYFLVDNRMLPFDNPQTPDIDAGSILYAPVFLANKNPDDFVQTVYTDQSGNEYPVLAYTVDSQGNTAQSDPATVVDSTGRCYFVSAGYLYRATEDCERIDYSFNNGEGVLLAGATLDLKDAYYSTMFYHAFVGGGKPAGGIDYPNEAFFGNGTAGKGLTHWRLVNGTNAVKLLQYYRGAVVTGKVQLQSGASLTGFQAVAMDPFGIEHDSVLIDANGTYRVLAPFSLPGEQSVKIGIKQGENLITTKDVAVSYAQAMRQADYNITSDVSIQPGTLNGHVFFDRDGNGQFNATIDRALEGANVTVDGRNFTTSLDGRFTVADALPGSKTITASKTGYSTGTATTSLQPGGQANVSIAMSAAPVTVRGTLVGADGTGLEGITVSFNAVNAAADSTSNTTAFTDEGGNFTSSLAPGGDYRVNVNDTVVENNRTIRYRGETTISVPVGSPPITIRQDQLVLTREDEGPAGP